MRGARRDSTLRNVSLRVVSLGHSHFVRLPLRRPLTPALSLQWGRARRGRRKPNPSVPREASTLSAPQMFHVKHPPKPGAGPPPPSPGVFHVKHLLFTNAEISKDHNQDIFNVHLPH
jgi:hypothetical protein